MQNFARAPTILVELITYFVLRFRLEFNFFLFFRVKIMLPWDPQGKNGPKRPLPDHVSIVEPKEETIPASPFSEAKFHKPDAIPAI